jgi:hypothetical protein
VLGIGGKSKESTFCKGRVAHKNFIGGKTKHAHITGGYQLFYPNHTMKNTSHHLLNNNQKQNYTNMEVGQSSNSSTIKTPHVIQQLTIHATHEFHNQIP